MGGWPPLTLPGGLKGRVPIQAPIPFGGESPSDYAVRGGGPLLGFANLYSHSWNPVGRGLGELLYSLALAPCEQINLAFVDWTRSEVDTRREYTAASERFEHELNHDRSISEVVDAVLEEEQSGSSTAGGGGASLDLGIFSIGGGGGHTTSSSSGRREIQASTVQEISDSVVQRGSALRSLRSTVVTTSVQRESERIRTRTVHNHNRNHAMTVQYFQVLSHYSVKTELVEEKPVLLIPYEIDNDIFDKIPSFKKFVLSPSRPITRFLDRHRQLLRALLPRRFRPAFEALSRLLNCGDVYEIEQPFATVSRWRITLDDAWRDSVSFSIETSDGQSYPLQPRRSGTGSTAEFASDPVKVSSIDALRVNFDHVRAAEAMGRVADLFGGAFEDLLERSVNHVLERAEVHVRTDRSRFVPEPQSYRMVVDVNPKVTLSASNPVASLGLTPPNVNFEGYRGREHQDYCLLKELIAHIQAHPMRYLRALWYHEDPDRRAMRFDRYVLQGQPLLDEILNRPVGVVGNYVAFPLLNGHRLVAATKPNHVVDERLVSLPTRGVFAEVFLSCCNATEKRDVERVIDPENACAIQAPEITGVQPGSRRERRDLTPTDFPSPIVNLQNAPNVPDPTGLASAFNVLKTPDIFRDLTRGAELLQFIDNATKEAFTSTRAHRAAMNELAGDILKAYLGIPPTKGSGGKPASSGTKGIKPAESGGGSAGSAGQTLAEAVSNEQVRQTTPQRLSDHGKVLKQFVDDKLMTPEQGSERANAMFGGSIMPASFIPPGPVATAVATQIKDFELHVETIRNGVSAHALLELTFWENAGAQLVESNPAVAGKLEDYARAAGVPNPAATAANFAATGRSPPTPPPNEEPWSAAFISYIMQQAGAAAGQFGSFNLNRGHDEYIKAARDNREAQDLMNPFWLTTLDEVAPEIGDLLCVNRGGGTVSFDPTVVGGNLPTDFRSHADVVTGISVNSNGDPVIVTLGGNLDNSVRQRLVPVDADFKVTATSHNGVEPAGVRPADPYFAVLRMRRSIFETYPAP